MVVNDPLADMLTRIRNACMVRFESVNIPHSKLKLNITKILKEEGYIRDYHLEKTEAGDNLKIDLKYDQDGKKVIAGLRRISKPGRRIYARYDEIPKVMTGLGISILSTSRGVMTDRKARAMKVGGEIICEVW